MFFINRRTTAQLRQLLEYIAKQEKELWDKNAILKRGGDPYRLHTLLTNGYNFRTKQILTYTNFL